MDSFFHFIFLSKGELSPGHQERSSSLVQEEPESVQIKQKLLQRPVEDEGSTLTSPAVQSDEDTEPLASTSTQHMNTQAGVEDRGTSAATTDNQLLSSSELDSDSDSGDEWEPTCDNHHESDNKSDTEDGGEREKTKQEDKDVKDEGKKRFSCSECSYVCSRRFNLNQHMRTHTGEKPFTCKVCSKGFRFKCSLTFHMPSHTWEKPFTCKVCSKGFTKGSQLTDHMTTHIGVA